MYKQDDLSSRFKDAPWYKNSKHEEVLVVGAGGIGSNSLFCLTKTIPAVYYVIDNDIVEYHNIGTQFFKQDQVNLSKVEAVVKNCSDQSVAKVNPIKSLYDNQYLPIMITALDNMKTRKQCFDEWKKHDNRELFIDGRLRANLYEVYVVTKGFEEKYEATLFGDNEVDDGLCTFKQTAYFGMLIGARITHAIVNFLTNKYSNEKECVVPFKIQEFGEPFYINTEVCI